MFWASMCPSSGETIAFMRHLALVILYGRLTSIQNNKYQVLHKCNCFSWWWAHSCPKHVEKRNKHTKKNCAPSWLYLQDYTNIPQSSSNWWWALNLPCCKQDTSHKNAAHSSPENVSDENKNITCKIIIFPTNWKRHLNTGTLLHSYTHTHTHTHIWDIRKP